MLLETVNWPANQATEQPSKHLLGPHAGQVPRWVNPPGLTSFYFYLYFFIIDFK